MSNRTPRPARSLVLFASVFMAAGAWASGLQGELRTLIASRKLGEARVGVCLMDARTHEVLASHHADEAFIPASNMKLLTSGAAMLVLGDDFSFRTELVLDGDRLVVKGSGDPALGDPEVLSRSDSKLTVDEVLASLAGAVSKAGVRQLSEIVIDDRVFDREYYHPNWNIDHATHSYGAQIGGINFHANVLAVFPRPAQGGGPPLFDTQPKAWAAHVDSGKARTVGKGNNSAWLIREGAGNQFTMRGDVRTASTSPIEVTITAPPVWFGDLLVSSLSSSGVAVNGRTRLIEPAEREIKGRVIAVVTTPIDEVLHRCNTDSANLYAEALLKRIAHKVTGAPGSWREGAAVLRMSIGEELGPDAAAETVVADGSGLARENRVTPATMARWLDRIASRPFGDAFVDSLAAPGEGTLDKRFRGVKLGSEVRGKSGYIKGVRCLSGYVSDPETGDRLVYSVLVNDLPLGGYEKQHHEAKALHEDIVLMLDRVLTRRRENAAARVGG
ncbi:MAG TPA: D-alanyl-D-alanine carboxypeptidase/D-alanyl-D-alanine-endopeptidase [Phycisphaerales bacterium]|nr:D-alanyl-D-alanine carboxypeptidase/D-alanyl-D-alanine-endopeptidase [Phycisphaerales bacterium]